MKNESIGDCFDRPVRRLVVDIPQLLTQTKTLLSAVTPGEAELTCLYKSERVMLTVGLNIIGGDMSKPDACLFVHAYTALPELVAEVERLQRMLKRADIMVLQNAGRTPEQIERFQADD